MQIYMFRETVYHIYIYAVIAYLIMSQLPRNQQHKVMVVFLLSYMSSQHLYSMYHDYGGYNADVTTYTMLLVCKIWQVSFAFRDGGENVNDLLPREVEFKLDEIPGFMEFMSYVCWCCGCIVGPTFEYKDFKDFMELTGHYKDMPRGSNSMAAFKPAMENLLGGILCIVLHVVFVMQGFSVYFCGTKEFITYKTFLMRVGYYFIAMFGQRMMYYVPWKFNDAASVSSGISYSKTIKDKDGNVSYEFERIVSIYAISLETGSTCIKMMADWNHTVHLWLNNYVQARIVEKGKRPTLL